MESSSAFAVGTNLLIGFGSNSKSTNGNAAITGDYGLVPALTSAVDDRDYLDNPCWAGPPPGTR